LTDDEDGSDGDESAEGEDSSNSEWDTQSESGSSDEEERVEAASNETKVCSLFPSSCKNM